MRRQRAIETLITLELRYIAGLYGAIVQARRVASDIICLSSLDNLFNCVSAPVCYGFPCFIDTYIHA